MHEWWSQLIESTAVWTIVGIVIGTLLTRLQASQDAKAIWRSLGGLLYGELVLMDPEGGLISDDPPTARRITLNALPQLLAPGVIDPQKEDDLLMQLIILADAVDRVNDKARTYNEAWAAAADRHPDMQRRCREDLQMAFMDYRRAHALTMRQIQIGRLGKPLPLNEIPNLTPKQRFKDWRDRKVRIVQHHLGLGLPNEVERSAGRGPAR